MRLAGWRARRLSGFVRELSTARTGDCTFCGLPCGLADSGRRPGINICAGCVDICIAILEDRVTTAGSDDSPSDEW